MDNNENKEKKIKEEICEYCGKKGWIGHFGYDNGKLVDRLCVRSLKKKEIICLDCIEKETNK